MKQPDTAPLIHRLRAEDQHGITNAVAAWLTSQGWSFERASIPGATDGYTTIDGTKRVVVDENLSPADAASTALHEAAHVILHSHEDHATYVAHRGGPPWRQLRFWLPGGSLSRPAR